MKINCNFKILKMKINIFYTYKHKIMIENNIYKIFKIFSTVID